MTISTGENTLLLQGSFEENLEEKKLDKDKLHAANTEKHNSDPPSRKNSEERPAGRNVVD